MNFTQRAKDWVSTSTLTPDQLADAYLKMQTKSATLPDDQADDATACLEFLAESFESAGGDLALLIEAKPNVAQCGKGRIINLDLGPCFRFVGGRDTSQLYQVTIVVTDGHRRRHVVPRVIAFNIFQTASCSRTSA